MLPDPGILRPLYRKLLPVAWFAGGLLVLTLVFSPFLPNTTLTGPDAPNTEQSLEKDPTKDQKQNLLLQIGALILNTLRKS